MNTVIAIPSYNEDISLILAINRFGLKGEVHNNPIIIDNNGLEIVSQQFSLSSDSQADSFTNLAINKQNCFATITYQGGIPEIKIIRLASDLIKKLMISSSIEDMVKTLSSIDPIEHNSLNIIFGNTEKIYHAQSYLLGVMSVNELGPCVNFISDDIKYPASSSSKRIFAHKMLDSKLPSWSEYYPQIKSTLRSSKYALLTKPSSKYPTCTKTSTIIAFRKSGIYKYSFFLRDGVNLKYANFTQLKYGLQ
jgi:hypothetical protein